MKKNYLFIAIVLLLTYKYQAQNWVPNAIQIMHNSADASVSNLKVWINDTVWTNSLSFQQASVKKSFASGTHTVGISPTTATSQAQSIVQHTFQVGPIDSVNSIDDVFFTINGLVGNATHPLSINSYTRATGGMPGPFQGFVHFYNGSTTYNNLNLVITPSVVVTVGGDVSNLAYTQEAERYFGYSATASTVSIAVSSGTTSLGTFVSPNSAFLGNIIRVVMNSSFSFAQKTTGVGFGMVIVPVAGGSVTPVTKIEAPTALSEMSASTLEVKVFPNPVNNILYLSLDNAGEAYNVTVNDLTGKKILELKNLSSTENKIDVSNLNKGIYLLTVKQGEATKTVKFVKD